MIMTYIEVCVHYILLVCFLSLKDSTCEIREKVYFISKAFFVLIKKFSFVIIHKLAKCHHQTVYFPSFYVKYISCLMLWHLMTP